MWGATKHSGDHDCTSCHWVSIHVGTSTYQKLICQYEVVPSFLRLWYQISLLSYTRWHFDLAEIDLSVRGGAIHFRDYISRYCHWDTHVSSPNSPKSTCQFGVVPSTLDKFILRLTAEKHQRKYEHLHDRYLDERWDPPLSKLTFHDFPLR